MLGLRMNELAANRPILLDNVTCVYCGSLLNESLATKEHVIGRRFVPKGKLNGQWNLIVRACKPCNRRKADLEDDLSAVSMQPDPWGRHAEQGQILAAEAARKARNSVSRRTGKPVAESSEQLTIKVPLGPGAEMTFTMTSPPQADSQRIFELSRLHLTAFFYWITYSRTSKRGGYWPGFFLPVREAVRSDWGNPTHRAFMEAVVDWAPRVLAVGADGFFKIVIRRHPSAFCWSWALEWNHKHRIIGFFGEQAPAEVIAGAFPRMEVQTIPQGPNHWVRYRTEVTLPDEEDKLFFWEG